MGVYLAILDTIAAMVAALATGGLLIVAWYQLRNLIRTNTITIVLQLEGELNGRKIRIDEISLQMRLRSQKNEIAVLDILYDDLEAAVDAYLNALDRLSYCILQGYLPDREWKQEYLGLVTDTIRNNQEKFGAATHYRNIKKLYDRWTEQ